MKEKTTNPKRVKGTVLFTVVSVMMVLIVFLTATLALATTANNRAKKSYSSAQTQSTAKAGVNAIISAMKGDMTFATAVAGLESPGDTLSLGYTQTDASGNVTQYVPIDFEGDTSLGHITDATISYVGTKWLLNEDNTDPNYMTFEEKPVLCISVTAAQGKEESTVTTYLVRGAAPSESEEGGGAGFVATGSATNHNHTSAYGGTYIGFNNAKTPATMTTRNDPTVFETDFQMNGDVNITTGLAFIVKEPGSGATIWGDLEFGGSSHGLSIISENATSDVFNNTLLDYRKIPYIYVDGTIKAENMQAQIKNLNNIPLNIFCANLENTKGDAEISADIYCLDETKTSIFGKPGDVGNAGSTTLYKWAEATIADFGNVVRQHTGGNFYTKGSVEINGKTTFNGNFFVGKNMTIKGGQTTIKGDLTVLGTLNITGGSLVLDGGNVYCDNVNGSFSGTASGYTYVAEAKNVNAGYHSETKNTTLKEGTDGNLWWVDADDNIIQNTYYPASLGYTTNGDGSFTQHSWGKSTIQPVTYDVYIRESDNAEVPESEAVTVVPAHYVDNATGATVDASAIGAQKKAAADGATFPREYEREVLLGEAQYDSSTPIDQTKIITTIDEVLKGSQNPYATQYTVPTTYATDVNTNKYNSSNVPSPITASCTLEGDFNGQTITVQTGDDDLWMVLGGNTFYNGAKILLDDQNSGKGKLNILIKGDVLFKSDYCILPKTLYEWATDGTKFDIITSKYATAQTSKILKNININIYSEKNVTHTLKTSDMKGLIGANIKAPYMNLLYKNGGTSFGANQIYYNGHSISQESAEKVAVIGCCIVQKYAAGDSIDSDGGNDATFLYVAGKNKGTAGDDFDDALLTSWRMLYYDYY